MNKNKVVMCGVGVLILLVLAFYIKNWDAFSQPRVKSKTSVDEVIQEITKIADKTLGSNYSYELDKEKNTFTLFVWDDSFLRTGKSAKAGYKNSQQSWAELTEQILSICQRLQKKFTDVNLGTTVAVCAVSAENHDMVLLMASKGKILYDATKD